MLFLSVSLLLSWTEVVQSQSRKPSQFVSVCSLLVVSFLLSAVVGGQGSSTDASSMISTPTPSPLLETTQTSTMSSLVTTQTPTMSTLVTTLTPAMSTLVTTLTPAMSTLVTTHTPAMSTLVTTQTSTMPSEMTTVVIAAVVTSTVLLLVVVVAVVVVTMVVVMVVVLCKRQRKDYQRGSKGDSKLIAASFALRNRICLGPTTDSASTTCPKSSVGAGSQASVCSLTTGQLKTQTESVYDTPCQKFPLVPSMVFQHYEFAIAARTESEHLCPANNKANLNQQLSQHHFQEIPRSSVIQVEQIGEGEFGVVCQGEWQNNTGVVQKVAIKVLYNEDNKAKLIQEAAAMGEFNHPHVVRLFGVVTLGKPAMIVLELLEKGDLKSYLLSVDPLKHPNLPHLLLKFSRQIVGGMVYLSSKDFVHRDLATRYILLDRQLNCKIADFAMSRDLANDYYLSQGGRVPLKWTAPEALLHNKYSTSSDVWSYGMVLFEIWSLGRKPFEKKTAREIVQMFKSKKGYCQAPPPGCPREIYAMMVKCWNPDHHKRPCFDEVFTSFSRPEPVLTSFGDELDLKSVPPTALMLGSPLAVARWLYLDLQHTYRERNK